MSSLRFIGLALLPLFLGAALGVFLKRGSDKAPKSTSERFAVAGGISLTSLPNTERATAPPHTLRWEDSETYAQIRQASTDELVALWQSYPPLAESTTITSESLVRMLIIGRLSELDPEVAWSMMLKIENSDFVIVALSASIKSGAPEKIGGLLRKHALHFNDISTFVFMPLIASEPEKAIGLLNTLSEWSEVSNSLDRVFSYWLDRDLAAAKDLLSQVAPRLRPTALSVFANQFASASPNEALQWMRTLPPQDQATALLSVRDFGRIASADPETLLELTELLPADYARDHTFAAALAAIGATNPELARDWFATRPRTLTKAHVEGLLMADEASPELLLEWYPRIDLSVSARLRRRFLAHAFQDLSDGHLENVDALIASLRAGDRDAARDLWVQQAISCKSLTFAERAEAGSDFSDTQRRYQTLRTLRRELSEEALASIADPTLRQELILLSKQSGAMGEMITTLDEISDQELHQLWVHHIAEKVSSEIANDDNAVEAFHWLAERYPQALHENPGLIRRLSETWIASDPTAASNWISSLPPGEGRDAEVASLVGEMTVWEPESAFEWTAMLSNQSHRLAQASNVLLSWSHSDPQSAGLALLQSAAFSEHEKALLSDSARLSLEATSEE